VAKVICERGEGWLLRKGLGNRRGVRGMRGSGDGWEIPERPMRKEIYGGRGSGEGEEGEEMNETEVKGKGGEALPE
jgi:hypothetical protein